MTAFDLVVVGNAGIDTAVRLAEHADFAHETDDTSNVDGYSARGFAASATARRSSATSATTLLAPIVDTTGAGTRSPSGRWPVSCSTAARPPPRSAAVSWPLAGAARARAAAT